MDFLSAILVTVQGANWQRGGGKGALPERISRPSDAPEPVFTADDLRAKRQAMTDHMNELTRGVKSIG